MAQIAAPDQAAAGFCIMRCTPSQKRLAIVLIALSAIAGAVAMCVLAKTDVLSWKVSIGTSVGLVVVACGMIYFCCKKPQVAQVAEENAHHPAPPAIIAPPMPLISPEPAVIAPPAPIVPAIFSEEQRRRLVIERILEEPLQRNANLAIVPRAGPNLFQIHNLGQDVELMMAMFLNQRDLLELMRVSRNFRVVASHDILWEPVLGKCRIWGPTAIWRRARGEGYEDVNPRQINRAPALRQLKEYVVSGFDQNNLTRAHFFEWAARYYNLGPAGFQNMPRLQLDSLNPEVINRIDPASMPTSIMRSEVLDRHALFIRLKDHAVEGPEVILAFVQTQDPKNVLQIPNAYWGEGNLLDVNYSRDGRNYHQNYVISIMNNQPFDNDLPDDDPRLRRTIRLA